MAFLVRHLQGSPVLVAVVAGARLGFRIWGLGLCECELASQLI